MHVLTVGSSVIDLFLSLDHDHVETHDGKALLTLGDKIPSEIKSFAIGGNGANNSVGLTRLEIPTSFYTYLGNDVLSREIEEKLTREGVELASVRGAIQSAPLHIILDFDSDRVILSHYEKVKHDFTYEKSQKFDPDSIGVDFIFLNSIADFWEDAYEKVYTYATNNNIPFAFSPGSRQLDNLNDLIYRVIKHTKIYFSNKEEAMKVAKIENPDTKIQDILQGIKALGPEIISITDGANGAYAADQDNFYFIKPTPTDAVEKTGAGDAYASAFFASYLHGNDIPTSMRWGVFSSEGVMKQIGSQKGLLTKQQLDEQLKTNNNLIAEKI